MSPVRPTATVVGRRRDGEAHRIRDFLTRIAQPYEWFEEGGAQAGEILAAHRAGGEDLALVGAGPAGLAAREYVRAHRDRWDHREDASLVLMRRVRSASTRRGPATPASSSAASRLVEVPAFDSHKPPDLLIEDTRRRLRRLQRRR